MSAKDSGRAVLKKLNTLNINYKGKPLDLNQVYAILGILTYQCPKIQSAVDSLETIAPSIFSEFTKIGRLCQTYKNEWQLVAPMIVLIVLRFASIR